MGENIRSWSTTAATNATADSSINWAEGQAPSTVNDSARSMMATIAKHMSDTEGALVTTGGTTAFLLTSSTVYTALASGLTLCIKFNVANTGASTLNVDGLGAKSIRKFTSGAEGAVAANDLLANNHYYLVYDTAVNSAAGGWILLNPSTVGSTTIAANSIDNTLLAQMATATLKGRATAGTGNAEDLTATQAFDALFSSTQGTIIYRNASAWTTLAPGTSGQVLKTNGAGANLSWTAAGGTGTVTSVATSGYVTGGPVTTTGTISLGSMGAASRIMGSGSGGSSIIDLSAGTGISIGASSISNSGVTSNVAGTGIGVSGATGAVTITNNGVTSAVAGNGISVSGATGAVTITQANFPTTSTGIGQWVVMSITNGAGVTLPASGTWAYFVRGLTPGAGVAAGGSSIGTAGATGTEGFAWRIA